ncbi:MAG: hypothetical protein WC483_01520 [Candidatus Paceibacterota bacterium]
MKFKQEMRETPGQIDKKKPFARFKEAIERPTRVAIAALAVSFAVGCGPDGPTEDGGSDAGIDAHTDGGPTDSGTDTGTDGGTPTGLCALYGPGHPNRITLALGQEVRVESETCESRLVFLGIIGEGAGNEASFGMYAAPETYPLGSWELPVGDDKNVLFKGIGWTKVAPCEISAQECDYAPSSHISSGDTGCTVTVAAERPWLP